MPRRLTPQSSIDSLKKEAKRWLKALRARDEDARARYTRAIGPVPDVLTLREVQHALARELGLSGWRDVLARIAAPPVDDRERAAAVTRFLDNACPDHHVRGGADHVRAQSTAMRAIARDPSLRDANFVTAVVCGDLDRIREMLASEPSLATARDRRQDDARDSVGGENDLFVKDWGAKGWTPLLYLTFTRLPLADVNANAVEIARLLLDHGADPNAYFMAGGSRYTPLVGAIGEGEEGRPAHPKRDALVELLLDRGAEPYDQQVVYNIHFNGQVLWFLEAIHRRSLELGRAGDWLDPDWKMLDMGGYGSGARWHLWMAVRDDNRALAEWCLAHGANPDPGPPRESSMPQGSLHDEAMRRGEFDLALRLRIARHRPPNIGDSGGIGSLVGGAFDLPPASQLAWHANRLDRAAADALLAAHPELRRDGTALFDAAQRARVHVVTLLLDAGIAVDAESATKEQVLHYGVYGDSVEVAQLLIDRGAAIDPVETSWQNTPLGMAIYGRQSSMIDLLSRYSTDIWRLVFVGALDRVRTLLAQSPDRARAADNGRTLLFHLPLESEAIAIDLARLLIAHGADPRVVVEGKTAAERADRLGMVELASVLRVAATPPSEHPALAKFERMATHLLDAYRTGTPEAMARHWADTWHRREWSVMRRYVQLALGLRAESEEGGVPESLDQRIDITLDDARYLIAREQEFDSWEALIESTASLPTDDRPLAAKGLRVFNSDGTDQPRDLVRSRDWEQVVEWLEEGKGDGIDAAGQMTDEWLERISRLDSVTTLRLGGSRAVTDTGVRHLTRMPQLRALDLSATAVTDAGLEVLRHLPALTRLSLAWTYVTDTGASHLAACDRIEEIDLSGTRSGNGALRALAGKTALRGLRTGMEVTDDGIAALHDVPVFARWPRSEDEFARASHDAPLNWLMLRGSITDRGLAALAGLDGLFALHLDNAQATPAGLAPLAALSHLGWFAAELGDEHMPFIAAMPRLRFLMCQDTPAGDSGFAALSRSRSIERIWGRRCHNLARRGFIALADMPSLRSLSVSCKNVDDAGLSALPRFPALRELMPMGVPDAGYRHIGQCRDLTSLVLMYCRDTGDDATSHLVSLPRLAKYFASYTQITDRTPALLSTIRSLESITLDGCAGVTDRGIAALATLPALKELRVSGMRHVTPAGLAVLPRRVIR